LLVFRAQKFKKVLCVQSPQGYSIENKILLQRFTSETKTGKAIFFFQLRNFAKAE